MSSDEPYYRDDWVTLHLGDCLAVLATLPDASIDSVVTDPPYALGFMGREWDGWDSPKAFEEWCRLWAVECLRVLKPGGHLLAFGGTRTWHRLACAIEDAGFEMRDSIAWLYGSGFPKSLDVSKAIDKSAGAAREVVGRYVPPNGKAWNLEADEARPGYSGGLGLRSESLNRTAPATADAATWAGWGTALKPAFEPIVVARKPFATTVAANVLAFGTGALNIDACRIEATDKAKFPEGIVSATERVFGGGAGMHGDKPRGGDRAPSGRWPANVLLDESQAEALDEQSGFTISSGGASRFFPTFRYQAKAPTSERPKVDGKGHPTVKPLSLMRWLVRLVTPTGGIVLDPFAGSGTTAEACIIEGFKCITIEREAEYLPLIVARVTKTISPVLDLGVGNEY